MPVEDVAWGTIVYRNAIEKGIGTKLNLWDEPSSWLKFNYSIWKESFI